MAKLWLQHEGRLQSDKASCTSVICSFASPHVSTHPDLFLLANPTSCFTSLYFLQQHGSLSQQVEPLTALIQMWWHATASRLKRWQSIPPPVLQLPKHLATLCLCHFPTGGVRHRLLISAYTNWWQRMCWLSLDCCLPLCILYPPPSSPLTPTSSPFTHIHTHRYQPGVHALSANTPQQSGLQLCWLASDFIISHMAIRLVTSLIFCFFRVLFWSQVVSCLIACVMCPNGLLFNSE